MEKNRRELEKDAHIHWLVRPIKIYQLFTVLEYKKNDQNLYCTKSVYLYHWFGIQLHFPLSALLWIKLQIISSLPRKIIENSCLNIFWLPLCHLPHYSLHMRSSPLYANFNSIVTYWSLISVIFQSGQASSLTGIQHSISFTVDCSEGTLPIWRNKQADRK